MVQRKIQLSAKECANLITKPCKLLLVMTDDDNVIHVPDIPMDVQRMFHKPIQDVEVNVCKHL